MAGNVEFVIIRHLPTAGNRKRQYIGWTDEPILETHVQALNENRPVIYGSDLQRAEQTAARLFPRAQYQSNAHFRECNFGEFEGKTYAQLEKDTHYRSWIDDPVSVKPPGGESLGQVEHRVLEAFHQLPPGACVITHGGPIRLLLARFAPDVRDFWSWDVPHGAVYRFRWDSERGWKEGCRCTSLSVERLTAKERT